MAIRQFLPLNAIKCAFLSLGLVVLSNSFASAETRALTIKHRHTGEEATITFKVNGSYDRDGLKKLNWMLRDWRKDEPTEMDPALFDIVWEVYRKLGASEPINVVSAYRSAGTNAMLRRRSRGVARNSQHIQGKAMDFFIPGITSNQIREAAMKMERGGVGFYPRSASAFIHLDSGSVRHWPKMSREQLARVFPDGNTVHIPRDGKPLSGFDTALARIQSRGGIFSRALAAINGSGDTEDEKDFARKNAGEVNIFTRLFGGNNRKTPEETSRETVVASAAQPPLMTAPARNETLIRQETPQKPIALTTPTAPPPPKPIQVAKFEAPLPNFAPRELQMMRQNNAKQLQAEAKQKEQPIVKLGNTVLPTPEAKPQADVKPAQIASLPVITDANKIKPMPLPNEDPRGLNKAKIQQAPVETKALETKIIESATPVKAQEAKPLEVRKIETASRSEQKPHVEVKAQPVAPVQAVISKEEQAKEKLSMLKEEAKQKALARPQPQTETQKQAVTVLPKVIEKKAPEAKIIAQKPDEPKPVAPKLDTPLLSQAPIGYGFNAQNTAPKVNGFSGKAL